MQWPLSMLLSLPAEHPLLLEILDEIVSLDQVQYFNLNKPIRLDHWEKGIWFDEEDHSYAMNLLCRAFERMRISGEPRTLPRKSYLEETEDIYRCHTRTACPACRLTHRKNAWCIAVDRKITLDSSLPFPARSGYPKTLRHPWMPLENSPDPTPPPQQQIQRRSSSSLQRNPCRPF